MSHTIKEVGLTNSETLLVSRVPRKYRQHCKVRRLKYQQRQRYILSNGMRRVNVRESVAELELLFDLIGLAYSGVIGVSGLLSGQRVAGLTTMKFRPLRCSRRVSHARYSIDFALRSVALSSHTLVQGLSLRDFE